MPSKQFSAQQFLQFPLTPVIITAFLVKERV
jgi:hypothetical protein